MAKIIIKLFLVLLLFVTFSNCTEDNNLLEDAAVNKNITNYRISKLNNKQVFDNDLVYESLSRFYPKEESLVTNKLIHNSEYGFSIDTDNVKYVEDVTNNSHSYNFKITRDNPENENLENLLIMSTTDGGYLSYIVDYGFTSGKLETIDETSLISRTTKYAPIDFDLGTFDAGTLNKMTVELVCVETYTWGTLPNDSGELNGDTPVFTQGWIFQSQECTWLHSGGGGGEGDGGFGNDTTGSGGGNSSNSGSDYGDPTYDPSDPTIHGNGGIISVPVDDDPTCPEPEASFLNQLTETFGEGNFTISTNCQTGGGESELPEFDSVSEFEAYVNSFNNGNFLQSTTVLDPNEIQTDVRVDNYPMEYMNFPQATIIARMVVTTPDENNGLEHIEVTDANVLFDGNSTLFEWDFEENFNDSGYQIVISESIDSYRVYMYGKMTFGGKLGSINMTAVKQVEIVIKYNLSNGQIDENWSWWSQSQ